MLKYRNALTSLAIVVSLGTAAMAEAPQKDIVDTAVGAGQFKTLVSLVQKAGLVDTLKGDGPFTVLAPTDKAFAKLPKSLVAKVTADKKLLAKVLTYHVIPGKVMSSDLKNGLAAKTVQGETVKVQIHGKDVRFNKSKVVMADVAASNGVIHAIDTVLIPPSLAK
jgi:uncharacterized surface protein with fasciclin (FAS1) repeats